MTIMEGSALTIAAKSRNLQRHLDARTTTASIRLTWYGRSVCVSKEEMLSVANNFKDGLDSLDEDRLSGAAHTRIHEILSELLQLVQYGVFQAPI